jgi:hypothetical protein
MSVNEIEYLRDRILLLEKVIDAQAQLIDLQGRLLEPQIIIKQQSTEPTPTTASYGTLPRFPFPRD